MPAGAVAKAPASKRVVGGTTVTGNDPVPYPFMASLTLAGAPNDRDGHFCGGSLIAPDRVLTAGHCALGFSPSDFTVVVGRKRLSGSGGQRLAVRGISVDPAVDPATGDHDVALLLLSSPAPGADTPIQPVAASPSNDDALWTPGTNLTVAGWGATDPNGTVFPDDLQHGTVARKSDATCQSDYADIDPGYVAADEVCANTSTTDACFGDSGGPLFTQGATPLQVGVVSFGSDTCLDPDHPGVYARLGAPSIRSFVTSANPTIQPFATVQPSVVPAPVEGAPSSCTGAQFGGSPATSQETAWGRLTGNTIELVGQEPDYTPTSADLGLRLVCAVVAQNAGGVGVAQSAPTGPVAPKPPDNPGTSGSPAPTTTTTVIQTTAPIATTTPTDAAAPRALLLNRACKRRRCTIVVAVSDTPPSAGVAGVTATLTPAAKRCKASRTAAARPNCKRPRPKRLNARPTGNDRFTIATGPLKAGRYSLALRAFDAATTVRLTAQ
jgi:trypsin